MSKMALCGDEYRDGAQRCSNEGLILCRMAAFLVAERRTFERSFR